MSCGWECEALVVSDRMAVHIKNSSIRPTVIKHIAYHRIASYTDNPTNVAIKIEYNSVSTECTYSSVWVEVEYEGVSQRISR